MENENFTYSRGQIYLADLDPVVGSEQGGLRPVLIIQNNIGNEYSPTVIVAPITGKIKKPRLRVHVCMTDVDFLPQDSTALLEQIRVLDKSRFRNYMGRIQSEELMAKIDKAASISIGLYFQNKSGEKRSIPNEITICLCPACVRQFYTSPNHIVKRVDPFQTKRSTCTYCDVREGYDYRIIERKKRMGNDEIKGGHNEHIG